MRHIAAILTLLFTVNLCAQEFISNIRVQTPQINTVDRAVFQTLESELADFMNNYQWTGENFGQNEKIECNFDITIIEELSSTEFKAEVTIQATRPIYNSSYKSMLFQHKDDDWIFSYTQFQPLQYNDNDFVDNLTSMLAFYAYLVLGYDGDSFAPEGGTIYFKKAEELVNRAQTVNFPGWKANENNKRRNRYYLVNNILNPRFKPLRNGYYLYHRQGLDLLYDDPMEARKNLVTALEGVGKANRDNPNNISIKVFTISKNDEIINVFGDDKVAPAQKVQVKNIMGQVDPINRSKFEEMAKMGINSGRPSSQYGAGGRGK